MQDMGKIDLLGLHYYCFITIENVKLKFSLCLIKRHAMNICVGWKLHTFLILAPDGGKWLASCPSHSLLLFVGSSRSLKYW